MLGITDGRGGSPQCTAVPYQYRHRNERKIMRLLIMGPQGVGKGTQAALLAEHYNIPAVSTGDIFRYNL